jgi:hypothetical protein
MPPKRWTTPDQQEFLDSYRDGYLKAKAEGRISTNFYPPLFEEWFKRYPERELHFPLESTDGEPRTLTAAEELELQSHLQARKKVCLP